MVVPHTHVAADARTRDGETGIDNEMAEQGFAGVGAWILGRNMFGPVRGPWPDDSWKGWWGDEPPYHTPVFVLTHHPRPPLRMAGGTEFRFVTEGIDAALTQARAAAGEQRRPPGRRRVDDSAVSARRPDRRAPPGHSARPARLREHLLGGIDLRSLGYECVKQRGGRARHPRVPAPAEVARRIQPAFTRAPGVAEPPGTPQPDHGHAGPPSESGGRVGPGWDQVQPYPRACRAPGRPSERWRGAEPAAKAARVGYLSPSSPSRRRCAERGISPGTSARSGYVEGQNLLLEARYSDGHARAASRSLRPSSFASRVDVIVAGPTTAVRAVQQATRTIPIVMAFAGDPVGEGFAAGLARPGGNITGHSAAVGEITTKSGAVPPGRRSRASRAWSSSRPRKWRGLP